MEAAALVALALGGLAQWATHYDDSVTEDMNAVTYKDFVASVHTGDLLLTSSTEISSITRMFTNSLWSHCGIAYWEGDRLYEWSAHNETEGLLNSRSEHGRGGPQLVPLEYLVSAAGSVFWRRVDMTEEQRGRVGEAVHKLGYSDIGFSMLPEFLVYLGIPFVSLFDGFGGGLACPHVVAATYAGAGCMDLRGPLSTYTPKSFSDVGDALWKVNVAPTKMVLGYDTTNLINIKLKNKL